MIIIKLIVIKMEMQGGGGGYDHNDVDDSENNNDIKNIIDTIQRCLNILLLNPWQCFS